jgi:hypothetical protein
MKIRTYILTAGAILALLVPAAAGAAVTGGGSISHAAQTGLVRADHGQTAQLKLKIKALKAALGRLGANHTALVSGNKALAYDNASLNRQVNDLWTKVRSLENELHPVTPQQLTPHEECVYSGNDCTADELCTIWGYGGCELTPVPAVPTQAEQTPAG